MPARVFTEPVCLMSRRTPPTPVVWVPTGRAVALSGISSSTLARWVAQGLLEQGREFRNGLTPTSPRRWNLAALEARIEQLRKLPDPLRPETLPLGITAGGAQ
jgi:hypothetical protein